MIPIGYKIHKVPLSEREITMGYGTSVEFLDTKTTIPPLYTYICIYNPNIAYTHGALVRAGPLHTHGDNTHWNNNLGYK